MEENTPEHNKVSANTIKMKKCVNDLKENRFIIRMNNEIDFIN